ncbi:hypothetical protein [Tardiphaga sp.]|uniref:hypothetical protein n=1 Tax=Tardiphaga sp. TaxID=1926292 RepID=UPI00352B1C97
MITQKSKAMSAWTHADPYRTAAIVVFALLTAASLLPTVLTPIPAMVDYPNHLARMYLLAENGKPGANPYYEVHWALYPNLGMDLLIPQMARWVGVENATRLFLLCSQLLIIGGALTLERVAKGRTQMGGFAALLFLYCLPFSWGFLNFEFGLGVSLWGVAAYLTVIERSLFTRFVVNAIFVGALFAVHFFSLGIYGAAIGFYELWRAHRQKASYHVTALRLMLLAVPVALLLVVMRATAGSVGSEGTEWLFQYKPIWLFRIMNGYNLTVSAACVLVLLVSLYLALKRDVLTIEPVGIWLAAGFALLYLVIPSKLLGTSFADLRIIPAAAMIVAAFCSFSLPSRRWVAAALLLVTGVILANLATVFAVWLSYRADYTTLIESFHRIDRGARVLTGTSGDGEDPPFRDLTQYPMAYAPTLAVHYANAFVPNLFTEVGKQPIRPIAGMQRLAIPYGGPVPIRLLSAVAAGRTATDFPPFIQTWHRDFDYLYVLGPASANPLPDRLQEVDRSARFVLYKIHRQP